MAPLVQDEAKACPACGLINLVSARTCDCGYSFESQTINGESLQGFMGRKQTEGKKQAKKGLEYVIAAIICFLLYMLIPSDSEKRVFDILRILKYFLYIGIFLMAKGISDIIKYRKRS